MKRTFFFFVALLLSLSGMISHGAVVSVPYVGCVPADGSTIESFDFEMEFDLSEMVSNYGQSDLYGLRINDETNPTKSYFTRLYRGDVAPENLIAECMVPTQTWNSENFVPGGKLKFSFPGVPEDGVKYTVSFGNRIGGCKKGAETGFKTRFKNYSESPMNLTFTGKSDVKLLRPSAWRSPAGTVESVSKVEAVFPNPISLTGTEAAILSLDGKEVAQAVRISVSDVESEVVVMEFDNVALIKDKNYLITLREGSVAETANPSITNAAASRGVIGSKPFSFKLKNPRIEYDEYGFPKMLKLDVEPKEYQGYYITIVSRHSEAQPNGTVKYVSPSINSATTNNSAGNITISYSEGEVIISCNYLTYSPGEEYYLYCPSGHIDLNMNGSNRIDDAFELIADSDEVRFRVPGIEEMGDKFPKIKLDGPVAVSEHHRNPELKSGEASLERLDVLEIKCNHYKYSETDETSENFISSTGLKGQLFEMTPEGDVLIKEVSLGHAKRGSNGLYLYPVATVTVNENLIAGKKYKIVIPKNAYRPQSGRFRAWVQSEPFTFIINGAMALSCKVESCSYNENDKIKKMTHALFYMSNEVEPVGDNPMTVFECANPAIVGSACTAPLKVINRDGKSILVADFIGYNEKTLLNGGVEPIISEKTKYYNLTLPAGVVHQKGYSDVVNEEYKIQLEISADAGVTIIEPEYITLSVKVNDVFVNTLRTVKGETVTVNFDLGQNWEITSLKKNGYVVLDQLKGTEYTSVPLQEDSEIEAVTEYTGDFMIEHSDGVFGIEGSALKVYADGGRIIVEGLVPGQGVSVYSTTGMTVGTAKAEKDIVSITVARGETYVVVVEGKAAKLLVK